MRDAASNPDMVVSHFQTPIQTIRQGLDPAGTSFVRGRASFISGFRKIQLPGSDQVIQAIARRWRLTCGSDSEPNHYGKKNGNVLYPAGRIN
jgi:hypothetical protein